MAGAPLHAAATPVVWDNPRVDAERLAVIGHAWARGRLERAIETGTLPQSLLVTGPASVGKASLAIEIATAVLSRDARDAVRARQLARQHKHPDLIWIELLEGKAEISIEQVRDLIHALSLAPVEAGRRVGVINDAHLASQSAQNAILKTLEEPSPSAMLIIIAPAADALLPTIVSRCQVLALRHVPASDIAAALEARGVASDRAQTIAHFARGRVGWALRAVDEPELLEERRRWAEDIESLARSNLTARFAYAEKLARDDDDRIQAVLDEWMAHWRVQELHSGTAAEHARVMRALIQTGRRIRQNVNARLALDALLLQLPEPGDM